MNKFEKRGGSDLGMVVREESRKAEIMGEAVEYVIEGRGRLRGDTGAEKGGGRLEGISLGGNRKPHHPNQ